MRRVFAAASLGLLCVAASLAAGAAGGAGAADSHPDRARRRLHRHGRLGLGPRLQTARRSPRSTSRTPPPTAAARRVFIDEGRWRGALALKGQYYLIQFGHNDEPGKGPERETDPKTTYFQNMARYVDEVRAIGATPVLVTSLVRRTFDPSGKIRSIADGVRRGRAAAGAAEKRRRSSICSREVVRCPSDWALRRSWPTVRRRPTAASTRRISTRRAVCCSGGWSSRTYERPCPRLRPRSATEPGGAQTIRLERQRRCDRRRRRHRVSTRRFRKRSTPCRRTPAPRGAGSSSCKPGTYREIVYVQREKRFVTLVGEDPARTIITYRPQGVRRRARRQADRHVPHTDDGRSTPTTSRSRT